MTPDPIAVPRVWTRYTPAQTAGRVLLRVASAVAIVWAARGMGVRWEWVADSPTQLADLFGRMLPPDVRPVGVRTVPASFSARRHAVSKTYAYTFDFTPWGDPFLARYALHLGRPPDRERLRRALERLPGRRDWSGFTAADTTVRNRVRRVVRAELVDAGPARAAIVFTGDGFLRHMVRNLVGTIVEIERGRMEVERIDRILASGDRRLAGPTAPAHGLCLTEVAYGRATMTPAMMPDEDENEDEDDG